MTSTLFANAALTSLTCGGAALYAKHTQDTRSGLTYMTQRVMQCAQGAFMLKASLHHYTYLSNILGASVALTPLIGFGACVLGIKYHWTNLKDTSKTFLEHAGTFGTAVAVASSLASVVLGSAPLLGVAGASLLLHTLSFVQLCNVKELWKSRFQSTAEEHLPETGVSEESSESEGDVTGASTVVEPQRRRSSGVVYDDSSILSVAREHLDASSQERLEHYFSFIRTNNDFPVTVHFAKVTDRLIPLIMGLTVDGGRHTCVETLALGEYMNVNQYEDSLKVLCKAFKIDEDPDIAEALAAIHTCLHRDEETVIEEMPVEEASSEEASVTEFVETVD